MTPHSSYTQQVTLNSALMAFGCCTAWLLLAAPPLHPAGQTDGSVPSQSWPMEWLF